MKSSINNYITYLHKWIVDYTRQAHADGIILGISGGIDSAVVAGLSCYHQGIKVVGVWMNIDNTVLDLKCIDALKKMNKFKIIDVDLVPIFNQQKKLLKLTNKLAIANLKSRLRTITLYALAQELNLLVAGTSNADEMYMGYFTKYGDSACDLMPIVHLTKQRVYEVAKVLGLPDLIINRAPSASLYENQTDEDEMGVKYKDIDAFLYKKKIPTNVSSIINRYHKVNQHKFSLPVKPKPFEVLKK